MNVCGFVVVKEPEKKQFFQLIAQFIYCRYWRKFRRPYWLIIKKRNKMELTAQKVNVIRNLMFAISNDDSNEIRSLFHPHATGSINGTHYGDRDELVGGIQVRDLGL